MTQRKRKHPKSCPTCHGKPITFPARLIQVMTGDVLTLPAQTFTCPRH